MDLPTSKQDYHPNSSKVDSGLRSICDTDLAWDFARDVSRARNSGSFCILSFLQTSFVEGTSYTSLPWFLTISNHILLPTSCHSGRQFAVNSIVSLQAMPVAVQVCSSKAAAWVPGSSFSKRYGRARIHTWVISWMSLGKSLNLSVSLFLS